jgi:hypothetical protein
MVIKNRRPAPRASNSLNTSAFARHGEYNQLGVLRTVLEARKGSAAAKKAVERMDAKMRMDAQAVLISPSIGVAEQFVRVFEKADKIPLPDMYMLRNFPVEGPGTDPFGYDEYKRWAVRHAGSVADATGAENDSVTVTLSSIGIKTKSHLRSVQYEFTWISQKRAAILNFDELGSLAEGARYEAARYHEMGYMYGHPSQGLYGVFNNPGVRKVYNSANGAGSILFGSSTSTEIWTSINSFLSNMLTDGIIEAYTPDTLMVPRWLMIKLNQGIVGMPGPGGTVTSKNLKVAVLESNPHITQIIENPRLDYRDENGVDTSALVGDNKVSVMIAYKNDTEVLHLGQPLPWEETPMWQKSSNTFEVRAYASHTGVMVRRPHAVRLLIV